jgi:hypothetical protein
MVPFLVRAMEKDKEFKSKAETALWFVESYGLEHHYLKLESTDGQTVKVDFNPSSSKSSSGIFPGILSK